MGDKQRGWRRSQRRSVNALTVGAAAKATGLFEHAAGQQRRDELAAAARRKQAKRRRNRRRALDGT